MSGEGVSTREAAAVGDISNRGRRIVGQFERGFLDPQSAYGFGEALPGTKLAVQLSSREAAGGGDFLGIQQRIRNMSPQIFHDAGVTTGPLSSPFGGFGVRHHGSCQLREIGEQCA
jgi:hypothetical protein